MKSDVDVLLLSVRVAFMATILILPIGTFLGWLFSRKDFRGKTLIDGAVNVPLVLPPVVTGYFLLLMLGPNTMIGKLLGALGFEIAFTSSAAVLSAATVSLPLLVRAVRVAVDSIDPRLEDASRLLRASEMRTFFKVTLPLARSGIVSGSLLAFARALGEFGATIVFAGNIEGETRTMPLAIFSYLNQVDGEKKAQRLVLAAIVLAYLSIILNEWLVRKQKHAANPDYETAIEL